MNAAQMKATEFNSMNAAAPVVYNVNSPPVYTSNAYPVAYNVNSSPVYTSNAYPVAYNVNSSPVYTSNTDPGYIATARNDAYLASPAVKRALLIIGVLQIIFGLICLGFGVAAVYILYSMGYVPIGEGVWCSIWVVIAGIIGCVGGCKQQLTLGIANTYLAFSIVSTIFMLLWIILLVVFGGVTFTIIFPIASLVLSICGASKIGCGRNGNQR